MMKDTSAVTAPAHPAIPTPSAALILRHQGRVLMLRRLLTASTFAGNWGFPGGKVDLADHPDPSAPADIPVNGDSFTPEALSALVTTALREAEEETGLRFPTDTAPRVSATFIAPVQLRRRFANTHFILDVEDLDEEAIVLHDSEHDAFRWATPQQWLEEHAADREHFAEPTFALVWMLAEGLEGFLAGRSFTTRIGPGEHHVHRVWEEDVAYRAGDDEFPAVFAGDGQRMRLFAGEKPWAMTVSGGFLP